MSEPGPLGQILLGGGLAFGAAIQPGPLQAFLLSRVVSTSWKRTLPASAAPLLSDGPIAVVALLVVGRLPPAVVAVLRAGGGALLLYLAVVAFRQWRRPVASASAVGAPRTLLEAVGVNLLNPNPYLSWALVLGPMVVAAWRRSPANAVAFVAAFYGTMCVTLAAIVFLTGAARFLNARTRQALVAVSAATLAAMGAWLMLTGAWELRAD